MSDTRHTDLCSAPVVRGYNTEPCGKPAKFAAPNGARACGIHQRIFEKAGPEMGIKPRYGLTAAQAEETLRGLHAFYAGQESEWRARMESGEMHTSTEWMRYLREANALQFAIDLLSDSKDSGL